MGHRQPGPARDLEARLPPLAGLRRRGLSDSTDGSRAASPPRIRVPDDPHAFFTEFVPRQYAESPVFPRRPTAAPAVFEVFDRGSWSLRVRNRALQVAPGKSEGTALQIATWREDFDRLFVRRARREVSARGEIPDELQRVFLPLFVDERRRRVALGLDGSLLLVLRDGGEAHRLVITPGTGEHRTTATVRMTLASFFDLTAGRTSLPKLLLRGELDVEGSKSHALQVSRLVG